MQMGAVPVARMGFTGTRGLSPGAHAGQRETDTDAGCPAWVSRANSTAVYIVISNSTVSAS